MISLHRQCLSFVPMNDAMYGRMSRILCDLQHRLETYDQFLVNPYTEHTSKPKFNSDRELELGEYDAASNPRLDMTDK